MKSVRLLAGHKVDFGGIVKSWTAQHVANRLQADWRVRRGFINAGGDVKVWGGATEKEPWCIGIANPFEAIRPWKLRFNYEQVLSLLPAYCVDVG